MTPNDEKRSDHCCLWPSFTHIAEDPANYTGMTYLTGKDMSFCNMHIRYQSKGVLHGIVCMHARNQLLSSKNTVVCDCSAGL